MLYFHLDEISRIGESIMTESRLVFARVWEGEEWKVTD